MNIFKKTKEKGLSLRLTFFIMLIVFLLITTFLLIMANHSIISFHNLSQATNTYIELQDAASGLMSASDYLTEEAQCYTVMGDRRHLDNYFTEAEQTRRREKAVEKMEENLPDSEALKELKEAMDESLSLMDREYYAMRLMLDAQGDTDIPAAMSAVTLTEADRALSADEKMDLAKQMMHDTEYYSQKDMIRSSINDCLDRLKEITRSRQEDLEKHTNNDLIWTMVLVIIQSIGLILMLWMTTSLGINPLLKAVEHIKRNQNLPAIGAHEFRYLAKTYNKMYDAYKRSIEQLSYKASHDDLTGVYNRAGYDLISQSVDPKTTAYMLFDADKFKEINDTMGHKIGDRVLMRIAATLKRNFRSDDYICRLGGDEFVVLMVHVNAECKYMIEQKVAQINRELTEASDDLPRITLSVGISFCSQEEDARKVLREADVALYHVKNNGRGGCCFYGPELGEVPQLSE